MMKMYMYMIMLNLFLMFINKNLMMVFMFNLLFILVFMFLNSLNLNFLWMNIYSWMGMDNFSMILIFLSILIFSLVYLVKVNFKNLKFYSYLLLILLIFLVLSFSSMNYFMFYLFFEISLIPTFMLIMGWGYQPERISASMYMLLYTMFASLPLLILIFNLFNYFYSLNYMVLLNSSLEMNLNSFILYFYMMFAFFVKLPLFMFHLWLPKAHIEAPVTGSMILAAILLKLGGYGCMRSMLIMLNLLKLNYLIVGLCLIGMIYLSIISMRCNDFKLIVAYSSVVHMGMMMLGLLSMSFLGFLGGFMLMVGHGFCSSAMFLMVNYLYERSKSRNMLLNKGMLMFLPSLMLWWFLMCVINMAAPISLNLLSEILILMGMFSWMPLKFMILLGIGMYFSAMYSLYLFSYIQHGYFSNLNLKFSSVKVSEFLNLMIHWIFLNFMMFKLELFI